MLSSHGTQVLRLGGQTPFGVLSPCTTVPLRRDSEITGVPNSPLPQGGLISSGFTAAPSATLSWGTSPIATRRTAVPIG